MTWPWDGRPGTLAFISGTGKHPDRLRGPNTLLVNAYWGMSPRDVKMTTHCRPVSSSKCVGNAWGSTSTATHTVAACTEAALIFSLLFPMRATRPSRVQTIKLLTHYCEEYLDLRKIRGRTWRELYRLNLGLSVVTRPLYGSRSFSFCRSINRLQNGADSFPQPSTDSAMN